MKTYEDREPHWNNRNDNSETEVDQIDENHIWANVNADFTQYSYLLDTMQELVWLVRY